MKPRKTRIDQIMNHGKVRYRLTYYPLGARKRRFFQTVEEAQKYIDDANLKAMEEGPSLGSIHGPERDEMVNLWVKLRYLNISPHKVLEIAEREAKTRKTVKETVDECLRVKAAGYRPAAMNSLRHVLVHFAQAFGGAAIADIKPEEIESWLPGQGASPEHPKYNRVSQGSRLNQLRTLFDFAYRRDWIQQNPIWRVESIRVVHKRPGVLSLENARKLMEGALDSDPGLLPYLTLCLFLGIRPEEAKFLKWGDIDMKEGEVEVNEEVAKTSQRRFVKVTDNARAWLELGGEMPPVNLENRLAQLRKRIGIYGKDWPHDAMRHSSASYLLAKTEDAKYTSRQMGHTVNVLLKHYWGLVRKATGEAFYQITPPADAKERIAKAPKRKALTPEGAAAVRAGQARRWKVEKSNNPYYFRMLNNYPGGASDGGPAK